jgi:hemoglobin
MRPVPSTRLLCLALVLTVTAPLALAAQSTTTAAPSLYTRLGGYDAIAAVTDAFIPRLVTDPTLAKFFDGHGTDSLKKIRQLIVDQLCAATGGPCVYIGRDMKTTHAGLGITKAQWDASVAHLVATLDQFKVPAKEKGEFLAIASTLEKDIVEKP